MSGESADAPHSTSRGIVEAAVAARHGIVVAGVLGGGGAGGKLGGPMDWQNHTDPVRMRCRFVARYFRSNESLEHDGGLGNSNNCDKKKTRL